MTRIMCVCVCDCAVSVTLCVSSVNFKTEDDTDARRSAAFTGASPGGLAYKLHVCVSAVRSLSASSMYDDGSYG